LISISKRETKRKNKSKKSANISVISIIEDRL
jgi:hypothetical protein